MLRMLQLSCLAMSIFLAGLSLAGAQEKKKPLAVEDLYLMESVKSPALFPKEEKLVYERVWIDAKTKKERHSLWLVTGKRENKKPLEEGEPDGRSPVVSPDGEWIAFLSTRSGGRGIPPVPAYSDPALEIWLYNVKTGNVELLVAPKKLHGRVFHDGFYGRVAFSPDSKRVVFVADDWVDHQRTKEEIENDVEIVRPDQGEGYTGYGPSRIWIASLPKKPPECANVEYVTERDNIWYGDPQWAPDGKKLVVVANKTKDRESVRYSINKNFDLYLIDLEKDNEQTQLTTNPGPDVSPRWSPDGKQIAYLSSPRNGPHRDVFELSIIDLKEGKATSKVVNFKDGERNKNISIPLDQVCWQGERAVWINYDVGVKSWSHAVDVDNGENVSNLQSPSFKAGFQLAKMLPSKKPLNDRLEAKGVTLAWTNGDLKIEGVLTTPPPEVAKPPYKLIVYPHGGPHSRSTYGFDFTVQLFAAHGYAVFQPNFRGSTGYGKKFLDANRLDLGEGDMRDILTGIDKLVKDGIVDPKRQFVYGISYGGFMASWLVGQTHQFKAAVAQNAVTDMNMMYALSDLQSWTTWELGGLPWEQPERYAKHSPLTHAAKVKTPTLILHSRDDRRCPLPMGKAFHQALLANNVPTQMVIYPNEGHAIRDPRHREDVYRRVLAWFAKYDK